MTRMVRALLIAALLVMTTVVGLIDTTPVTAQGTAFLSAAICRDDDEFVISLSNEGDAPGHYGYVAPWTTGTPTVQDLGTLDPRDRLTLTIEVIYDSIGFFQWDEARQQWNTLQVWHALGSDWVPSCHGHPDKPDKPDKCEGDHPPASCDQDDPPVPGCDQFMPIDKHSRMVTFAVDTPLLWAPDDDAQTGFMVLAGQTAWMIGHGPTGIPVGTPPRGTPVGTGRYLTIVWACDVLWVDRRAIR